MSDVQLIQTPCVFGENGNFLLERELGRGGMGGVYLGRDKMLDRPVAVKVMLREFGADAEFVERFKKEAQAAARLIHPNIAQIYSYGIADEMPYIAMELVAGGSLDQIMRNSGANSDVPRVMKICEQVAQALRCAADQGLVHGDIKPENVLLDSNGNAKLVDFGLAAMQKDTDEIWGTPYYIAPEKVRKEAVDYRADMYSLGGTLYHALCGVAPFEGSDASSVVRKRFEVIPRKPSEVRPGLSPQIDALVMRMLAFNPGDRYPSFEALLADFKAVMTIGLSSSQILKPIGSPAESSSTKASGGKKKIMLKPKKGITIKPKSESDSGDEEAGESDATGKKSYKFKINPENNSEGQSEYEDEESGGNIGAKIAMFVGIVIGIIVLVGGGLWFLSEQNKKSSAESVEAGVKDQINADKEFLQKAREQAAEKLEKIDECTSMVVSRMQKGSDNLAAIFKGGEYSVFFENIKPEKTADLIKAENALNPPRPVETPAEGQPAGANGAANQAAAPQPAQAPKALTPEEAKAKIQEEIAAGKRFRLPTEDESDPASPEYQDYLKEKKEWEEAQKAKREAEETAKNSNVAETGAAEGAASQLEAPACVGKMQDLWRKSYSIQAKILSTKKEVNDLIAKIDANLSNIAYNNGVKAALRTFVMEVEPQVKSFDGKISEIKKEINGLNSEIKKLNGKTKTEEDRKRYLKEAKERAERKKLADEEKARKEKEAREALIAEEIAAAKSAFELFIANGTFRRLMWKDAESDLKSRAELCKSAEGRRRVLDMELKKVQMMKSVQDIFIRNMKGTKPGEGYVFTSRCYKNRFYDKMVASVDEREIVLINKDRKGNTSKYSWQTIYSKYPLAMNELWQKFILNGRENGVKKLTLREWADAQLGFAMTLKIVCSNVEGAEKVYRDCAMDAVKKFPRYKELAAETFPEIDFSAIEAEAAENTF